MSGMPLWQKSPGTRARVSEDLAQAGRVTCDSPGCIHCSSQHRHKHRLCWLKHSPLSRRGQLMFSPGFCWVFFLLTGPLVRNLPVKGPGKGQYASYLRHVPRKSNTGKMVLCVCPNPASLLQLIRSISRAAPLPALNGLKDYF